MSDCPSELERERLLAGVTPGADAPGWEGHLSGCAACRSWLETARADEDLLASLRGAVSGSPLDATATKTAPSDKDPGMLGRYRILSRLGAGGMGVVYEAEQSRPSRRVALKVLRPGFVSDELLRRFELEAEILGRLEHQGIARIFEVGTFGSGADRQPFLAMELVVGRPLDLYLAEEEPTCRDRLLLFRQICSAISHAHQKGVIHRDLKPANVLVTSRGNAKVLDFGVARLAGTDRQGDSLVTSPGQLVGTVPYMSPEQVDGDPAAIDARSDIYSLGVLLYEILSGRRPYETRDCSVVEAARIIREQQPVPLGQLLPAARGDLETIAATALEKDPARRYGSVGELAADVVRHLGHEPISARPPTTLYQLTKFARRHRVLVLALSAILLALTIGIATTAYQWWRAELAQQESERARRVAVTESDNARAVKDFLMKMVVQGSPNQRRSGQVTIEDAFEAAANRVEEEFLDRPLVRAELHQTLGFTLNQMNSLDRATAHFEQARDLYRQHLGEDSLPFAAALAGLGQVELNRRNIDVADRLLRDALDRRLALGEPDRWLLSIHYGQLALIQHLKGRTEEAIGLYRESIDLARAVGDEHPEDLALGLSNFAFVLAATRGDLEEALAHADEGVDVMREQGRDAPLVLRDILSQRAAVFTLLEDWEGALADYSECVILEQETLTAVTEEIRNSIRTCIASIPQEERAPGGPAERLQDLLDETF